MNLIELKQSLSKKDIHEMYVFYGDEYAIMEIYIKNICKSVPCDVRVSDSVKSVYKTLSTKSLLDTGRVIYIIRDDKDFLTQESMWLDINKRLLLKNTTIILKYHSLDSRGKFVKQFGEYITKFDLLTTDILLKYIKKELNLKEEYCRLLVDICKNNYGRILLEINKVKNISNYYNLSDDDSFKLAINANIFSIEAEDVVTDLVDSIMTRNKKLVVKLLQESKEHGDNDMMLLSYLHNAVKSVLQIQTAGTESDLGKVTGLSGYQIKSAYKYVNRYTCEELINFMKYIKYCESSIKNGAIIQDMIIDYLLINVL